MAGMTLFKLLPLLAITLVAGCALRPPQSSETQHIDSVTLHNDLVKGIGGKPFCLHLRYTNRYWGLYSDTRAESWATDGPCSSEGAPRPVETLRLSWWFDWHDAAEHRQCLSSDACRTHTQHVVLGRHIHCASAQARDGNQTAFLSTNHQQCR